LQGSADAQWLGFPHCGAYPSSVDCALCCQWWVQQNVLYVVRMHVVRHQEIGNKSNMEQQNKNVTSGIGECGLERKGGREKAEAGRVITLQVAWLLRAATRWLWI